MKLPLRTPPALPKARHRPAAARLTGLVLFLLLGALPLLAQKKDKDEDDEGEKSNFVVHHSLEGGLAIGGQISNEVFVLKSGISLAYAAEVEFSSRVYYGLGLGMDKFREETFFPVFGSFRGMLRKKDNSPFLAAQFGYAFGSHRNYAAFEGYDFRGGVVFSPGLGYRFAVGDKFSGLMGVYYKHQFAQAEYRTYDGFRYRSPLNYDLVCFRVGILL
ncbi:MAG TPA: hypothetical protein VF646_04660 [Cytophagales bacterium]|jgi:hypothetical protein